MTHHGSYIDPALDGAAHTGYESALGRAGDDLGRSHPIIIGGNEIPGGTGFEVRSPVDPEILVGRFPAATPRIVKSAVSAALEGSAAWQALDISERTAIIGRTAGILEAERFRLAALITCECGKTRYEALAEVGEAVAMLRYHAECCRIMNGFVTRTRPESERAESESVMRPYGVWAVISPFNFPLSLTAGMAGAALISGNTVVLKPPSAAPLSALFFFRACREAGVPPSALQYVCGPGDLFGDTITAHPDVGGIAFTGSRDAGRWLARRFSARQRFIKPLVLEMGSKNPVIVTRQADLEKAAEGVCRSAFGFSGQKCSAASRLYVDEAVADEFTVLLTQRTEGLVTGDPRLKETFTGPLISAASADRFVQSVATARADGGHVVCGGEVLTGGIFANRQYAQPTIITGLTRRHPIVRTELFVPILTVDTFRTLDEAITEANATDYGLTAGIFSEDEEEVSTFFSRIRSGVTYANRRGGATTGAWPGSQPFCGWGASGSTGKGIGGPYYLLSFMREQARTTVR